MTYECVRVSHEDSICRLQLHRPNARNAIDTALITECRDVLMRYRDSATVIVIEGLPDVFCSGADFAAVAANGRAGAGRDPSPLYDLWLDLATGPFVTIAHVRGETSAGGVGFVAACDIALADDTARFSLPELLFGLMPACVLPFLIRRIGLQKAHYLTLTTQPISAADALRWGLVDACDRRSDELLRRHLLRLRRLSKTAVTRYKRYMAHSAPGLTACRAAALAANREVFSDPRNLDAITRFVQTGEFPWEKAA
jgi:polyketide biosynthesis enoyl-CoA hydratase PksH